ncbi:MAG TPA: hypothetical protein DEA27_01100 [Candidatus Moranbacteria bacterium]|nr:hypothetical protein [Candidatus Moranbacteria bacterium]
MRRYNGNGKKKKSGKQKPRMICWRCKRPMSLGNSCRWGNHRVHKGDCYSWCCKNLITGKNLADKIRKQQQPRQQGFFARLFFG